MDISAFLEEFRQEAGEHLSLLDASLLRLEREGESPEQVRQMFLSVHTIKGGASMLSLGTIKALSHALEEVLGGLRDGRHPADAASVALLFEALDALRALVEAHPQTTEMSLPLERLIARLREWPLGLPTVDQTPLSPVAPHSPSPTAQPGPSSAQALLVQPSATVRALLTPWLERLGWTVQAVGTLEEGLELLNRETFALLLCADEPGGVPLERLPPLSPDLRWVQVGLEPSGALEVPPGAVWVRLNSWREALPLELPTPETLAMLTP